MPQMRRVSWLSCNFMKIKSNLNITWREEISFGYSNFHVHWSGVDSYWLLQRSIMISQHFIFRQTWRLIGAVKYSYLSDLHRPWRWLIQRWYRRCAKACKQYPTSIPVGKIHQWMFSKKCQTVRMHVDCSVMGNISCHCQASTVIVTWFHGIFERINPIQTLCTVINL